MHSKTRKSLINFVTGIAVAAAAVVVFMPGAQAAPGTVTTNVNVRSGPGTNYGVVAVARQGDRVDIQQCERSWCYINAGRTSGWVSQQYLQAVGGNNTPNRPSNNQPGFNFGIDIPGGPSISIGTGNQRPQPPAPPVVRPDPRPPVVRPEPPRPAPPPRPPRPQPVAQDVCFFDRTQFRGESFCLRPGDAQRDLRGWTDRISSLENPARYTVEVCSEPNFRGCRTYTTSASSLGDFDNFIASIRIR